MAQRRYLGTACYHCGLKPSSSLLIMFFALSRTVAASSPIYCNDGLFYSLLGYVSCTLLVGLVLGAYLLGNSERAAQFIRWLEEQGIFLNFKMRDFSESFQRAVPPTAEQNSWYIDEQDLIRIACIGQGNMGQVWFAKWNGTRVAVKTILGNWANDEAMVERFKDEINLMCTLVCFC